MKPTRYRDLPEYHLLLVGPQDANFSSLASNIASKHFDTAAVLLNQSEKAIVALTFIWRYTTEAGQTRTNRHSNLGSSIQMDVLCGRAEVPRDLNSFILPGSKRLITEHGIFGNNLDVLPSDFPMVSSGGVGSAGGFRKRSGEEIAEMELYLDVAIFEDGLCVGPDESGVFNRVSADLERQRVAAQEILTGLRLGASEGQIFEILQPLARRTPQSPLLSMFASMAIHQLINLNRQELESWFERFVQPSPIRLHRPD